MNDTQEKLQFLLDLQDAHGGSIPFERWMSEALYHPDFGYYTAGIRGIGRRGDFTTWPVLHEGLARGIARWALENKPPGRWNLIEIGAGTGELAEGILRAIGWWNRPRYHIVEISPPLRGEQQKRLGRTATWHESVTGALDACDGTALIFSNELVDAFPARVFQKTENVWRELALRIDDGRIVEMWLECPLVGAIDPNRPRTAGVRRPCQSVFDHEWPEDQRVEVQESYRTWIDEWLPAWKSGAMLTIDYGDTCPALYHRRPHGTLRAYAHHQRLEGAEAYAGFGLRDLTVDVNFSDLIRWTSLSSDLLSLGEFLARFDHAPATHLAAAGEAFKALLQSPG